MSSPFVLGAQAGSSINDPRYLYALRKDDDGTMYMARVDINSSTDTIELFPNLRPAEFEDIVFPGDDYFANRDATTKELTYDRDEVKYEQWRWDPRLITYYINDNGEFVMAINQDVYIAANSPQNNETKSDLNTPFIYTFYGRNANVNLGETLIAAGWDGLSAVILVNEGTISTSRVDRPALNISASYSNGITIINNGKIFGANAFTTADDEYYNAGNAIDVTAQATIENHGQISGGYSLSSATDGYAIKGINNVSLTNTGTIGTTI